MKSYKSVREEVCTSRASVATAQKENLVSISPEKHKPAAGKLTANVPRSLYSLPLRTPWAWLWKLHKQSNNLTLNLTVM